MLPLQDNLLLQEAQKFSADSLKAGAQKAIDTLSTTSPEALLSHLWQQCIDFGLKVLGALAIYLIGGWIIKQVKKSLNKALTRRKLDATLISFANSLTGIVLWIILIVMVIGILGINTTSFAALLASGGVAIGMAFSGTLQNFSGGIMLLIFKPFKAGDFIEAQGFTGQVHEVNISSTKLITPDNRLIIIPNGALFNGNINNISAHPFRRVETQVSVSYGSDAEAVRAAILDILKTEPLIHYAGEESPEVQDPVVALVKMNNSSVDFIVRVWCRSEDYWTVLFSINEKIYAGLPGRGINFPFPQLDVHVINQ